MESLEVATSTDSAGLRCKGWCHDKAEMRCKGWCHDYSPGTVYHSDTPGIDYFE